jgi:putative methionine-R-sulfoxide reductase with GAF domain
VTARYPIGPEKDAEALTALAAVAGGPGERSEKSERAAEIIRGARGYRWVGVYEVGEEEITALGWSGVGQPAHSSFPVTQGLCGSAARTGRTVVVGDVRRDPRYLATFGSTLSEIVVPVRPSGGALLGGLIDVESDRLHAFSSDDQAFLERCAGALARLWA